MNFAETAWDSAFPWFETILAHPFVRSLCDGSLDERTFVRYLVDDAHYLDGYARALALIASRAPDAHGMELFAGAAVGATAAERHMQRAFLLPRGIDPGAGDLNEPSPTCRAYVGFLEVAAALGPLEIAVAAILPCFRVYAEVGRALLATRPGPEHPYGSWIQTYAAPEFDEAVRAVENYADRLAATSTDDSRNAMATAYLRATRFEWMFWDSAWRAEAWPEPGRRQAMRSIAP